MACSSPASRGQPLGRIVEDTDDTAYTTGSLSEPGKKPQTNEQYDLQLQASDISTLIYYLGAQLVRHVPQPSLTCESLANSGLPSPTVHSSSSVTTSRLADNPTSSEQHQLALVSPCTTSSSLVPWAVTQQSLSMDQDNRHNSRRNGQRNDGYDNAPRRNRNPQRSASEYLPGHPFRNIGVEGTGTSHFGNVPNDEPGWVYHNNTYDRITVRGNAGALFGDIPPSLALQIIQQNNAPTHTRIRETQPPSSQPLTLDPISRTASMPTNAASNARPREENRNRGFATMQSLLNVQQSTTTMVSDPEQLPRQRQPEALEAEPFLKHGPGHSLKESEG